MFERFTDRARRVLVLAQEEARVLGHPSLGTDHILLGLIDEGEGVAAKALWSLGIRHEAVRAKIEDAVAPPGSPASDSLPFTSGAKKVLELSLREALQLGHNHIGTEHMLLGLLREGGVAVEVLVSLGADLSGLRQQVILLLTGDPTGGTAVQEQSMGRQPGPGPSRPGGPRCPTCRALLEGQVAYRVLTVAPEEPVAFGPLPVAFVYCRHCGVTISHTLTGRGDPALGSPTDRPLVGSRAAIHLRPPAPSREFPAELWNAPPLTAVPPTAVVDVRHSGRFRDDGRLRGTIAGSAIDLVLELPSSASSATGTLDDLPVNVTWSLSYDSAGDLELPAILQGSVGDTQVELQGLFRHTPDYWFDSASVRGTLADTDLAASIERASGGYDSTDTIVATGSLGGQPFEVFAALGGSLERGRVRGTYVGQPLHLDLTATHGTGAHVTGACPTPPSFALLLIASILFFV